MAQNTHSNPAEGENLWGEPISVYTDEDARRDGFLVDITHLGVVSRGFPLNRITRHLYEDLKPYAEVQVPLGVEFGRALASILQTKGQFAKASPGNTGEIGDIWHMQSNLWLVRNDVGGWTAMYPEDY